MIDFRKPPLAAITEVGRSYRRTEATMTTQIPADRIAAAQADPGRWRIPPCSKLAQDGVESAFGRFEPPASNNPFGIQRLAGLPFVSAASHEFRGGKLVPVTEEFAQFKSLGDAYYEHDKLIARNPVYAPAMAFVSDYTKFIELMGPRYATAPNYVKTLLALIEEDGLARYDAAPIAAPAVPAVARTVVHLTPLTSIKSVQDALNRLGASPQLDLDGKYGVLTRAAVRRFQSSSRLTPDGDIGPLTIAALARAAATSNAPAVATAREPAPVAAAPPAAQPTPVERHAAILKALAAKTPTEAHEGWLTHLEEWIAKFRASTNPE
jgi:hypothetical protein